MDIDPITLAVILGAAARLWHLGGVDKLSIKARMSLPLPVTKWLECPRCSGFWWALAAAAAWYGTAGFYIDIGDVRIWPVHVLLVALAVNWVYFATIEYIADRSVERMEELEAAAADRRRNEEYRNA